MSRNRYLHDKPKRDFTPYLQRMGVAEWIGAIMVFWLVGIIAGKLWVKFGG